MSDRDFKARPYTPDEERVCDYLQRITASMVGCGDDPIGFLIASHAALVQAGTIEGRLS